MNFIEVYTNYLTLSFLRVSWILTSSGILFLNSNTISVLFYKE